MVARNFLHVYNTPKSSHSSAHKQFKRPNFTEQFSKCVFNFPSITLHRIYLT